MKVKYQIKVYKDKRGEWRWGVIRYGRIIMDSGEGYKRRSTMLKSLDHFLHAVQNDDFLVTDIHNKLL